ncbi:hypothetical protein TgHK011_004005 [Trichoderma gracile]|nr:hypothetical protein TgHK011_004005 [Trichoderma gracile]
MAFSRSLAHTLNCFVYLLTKHSNTASYYTFLITSTSHTTIKMIESCSKPTNFGRGAYDTTGLPKPPPPQPQ